MSYVQEVTKGQGLVKVMEHGGFKARLMKADRLENREHAHALPPGDPLWVVPIACLPAAPKGWIRDAGAYVCPVDTGYGLWFDWTRSDEMNTAVLPSVKGMNPITGQKIDSLTLEQYADKCPVHDENFSHMRNCSTCGFNWPPQNYPVGEDDVFVSRPAQTAHLQIRTADALDAQMTLFADPEVAKTVVHIGLPAVCGLDPEVPANAHDEGDLPTFEAAEPLPTDELAVAEQAPDAFGPEHVEEAVEQGEALGCAGVASHTESSPRNRDAHVAEADRQLSFSAIMACSKRGLDKPPLFRYGGVRGGAK